MRIPAITLRQPWASLIAGGLKTIETRTHDRFRSLVRFRVLIHAGRQHDQSACRTIKAVIGAGGLLDWIHSHYGDGCVPQGVIVAVARVAELEILGVQAERQALCATCGLWGLRLEAIRRVSPAVPAVGRPGLWYFDCPDRRLSPSLWDAVNYFL